MQLYRFACLCAVTLYCLSTACTSPVESNLITNLVGTQELYIDRHQKSHLSWSPDSSMIVYQTPVDTTTGGPFYTIYIYDLQQDTVRELTPAARDRRNCFPTFAADSKTIFFTRDDQLYKMSLADGQTSPLTSTNVPPQRHLDISPDGRLIACDDGQDIHIVSVDDGAMVTASESISSPLQNPSWSPDGQRLACESPDSLIIFVFANDEIVRESAFAGEFGDITWARHETSPFGSVILYRNGPGIATINPETGEIYDAFDIRKKIESFCWAPNSHDIAFSTPHSIYRAPLITTIGK
ncbi:PD40 domain-containing protein [candidate division KSB1 bacterium]|nr:PD40 domain-containing protein [candidate division KSB1 bacterium]